MERTRASLLLRLQDLRDRESWEQFVEFYGPMILAFLRRLGVSHNDALDLSQDVLQIVMVQIGTGRFVYDPSKRFRAWLKTVTRNRARRHFQERARSPGGQGGTDHLQRVGQLAEAAAHDDPFEKQWRDRRLQMAAEKVRKKVTRKTWEAFCRVTDGESPQHVADSLGMTVGALYTSRSRVIAQLKQAVGEIDE